MAVEMDAKMLKNCGDTWRCRDGAKNDGKLCWRMDM